MAQIQELSKKIVSLCKRRGFVYPSSEIYGGLGNVYDYGPLGAELLRNIRSLWWKNFIHKRFDVVGLDSQILMHPKVWIASGHVGGFNEPLIDCRNCKNRYRVDHLITEKIKGIDTDTYDNSGLQKLITDNKINCPNCGNFEWTDVRNFNQMFETELGFIAGEQQKIYLRPETAQGMYVQFKNILASARRSMPFGIAQIGKAFRNEVTKGKFIFRTLEFEQMELQYFIKESVWDKTFEDWRKEIEIWYTKVLGIDEKKFTWKPHHPEKLAHYAKKAEDYEYEFSTGFGEVSGLHYRTDFDLKTHQEHSGESMEVQDLETNDKYIPHVVESTFGLNRNMLMILDYYYAEEEGRTILKLPYELAPYKVAVFPLVRNKPEIIEKAKKIYKHLIDGGLVVDWDDRGNIGKRYLSQDEVGTPYCVTIDYETLDDNTVTVRDRDTMAQERVYIDDLVEYVRGEKSTAL
jgi:glycyl-tRNA synthetase